MKTLKMLMLFMAVSTILQGQTVVDHSAKFPPIRSQQCIPDCGLFSFIYYLGTYELCQKYGLDPKLEENQLNHNFVWNQMAGPYGSVGANNASIFMGQYGCATVADMPINEEDQEIMPSLSAKEHALHYRAKPATSFCIWRRNLSTDMEEIREKIEMLKDSLRKGVCFSMDISLFERYFSELSPVNTVYGCDSAINKENLLNSHYICVVGYDDTIKTPEGRGAFIVLDPSSSNNGGRWYYDYNWFFLYEKVCNWCYFFQEDFGHEPELTMKLDLSGTVTGDELISWQYCFADKIFQSSNDRMVDYDWESYLMFYRMLQIEKINDRYPEKSDPDLKYLPVNGKVILLPQDNHDGHRQLVSDLTDYISASEFESLEVLVQDPVSAEYLGQDGKVLYSFEREANARLNEGYIKYHGTEKRIYGKVVNLPDTTVVCKDFYSYPVGAHQGSGDDAYISKSTSVIRRFLITFNIADTVSVSGIEEKRSSGLTLSQNYPNPVGSVTTISFSIVERTPVTLKVYDLMGKEIETLVSADLTPGEHQIRFDANRLAHGVYVYVLRTSNNIESKRMIKE